VHTNAFVVFCGSRGFTTHAHTQEFDVESIMLLDENELKEMEIPRGPRLKILNRIKAGNNVNTTNISTSGGGSGGPSSASISRTSSASLNSSAESLVVDDAGAGSSTPPPARHDLLNPLDLEEVPRPGRQARLSWGPTPEGESPGGSPRSSPSSPLHSSPHPMAEDSSSLVAGGGGGGVVRKFKRDSGEMRRKLAEVQRSPGRSNHSNAFLKKSVSDLEDQMSASDGYRPRCKRPPHTHTHTHTAGTDDNGGCTRHTTHDTRHTTHDTRITAHAHKVGVDEGDARSEATERRVNIGTIGHPHHQLTIPRTHRPPYAPLHHFVVHFYFFNLIFIFFDRSIDTDDRDDEAPGEGGLVKKVLLVDASAPIKTVKKMAITEILPKVSQMPIEKQKAKKVGGVVRPNPPPPNLHSFRFRFCFLRSLLT
jgi:hypothetical protein